MSTDSYTLDAYEIVVKAHSNEVTIPVEGCTFELEIQRIEHFSSRGGLRCAERSLITGPPEGRIHFIPTGEMQISMSSDGSPCLSFNRQDYTIPELLDMIIQKQQEEKENGNNEHAY